MKRAPKVPRSVTRLLLGTLGAALLLTGLRVGRAPAESDGPFADFVEPGFPFIVSTVDARHLGSSFPVDNVATRGIVLLLGNQTYATFDPDLLRMAVGWQGDFLSLTTMAQVSYQEAGNKNNDIPRVLGRPIFATGIYPGWAGGTPGFSDPRTPGPNPEDVGRGPLPAERARFRGTFVVGDRAVLAYTVGGTDVYEQPGSVRVDDEVGIVRTFRIDRVSEPLTLVLAEVRNAGSARVEGTTALLAQGDTMTAVGVADLPPGAQLRIEQNRYVTLRLPRGIPATPFRAVLWRGRAERSGVLQRMLAAPQRIAKFAGGGPRRWAGTVRTLGEVSTDTSAYVIDRLGLPIPNPWKRNVRVADVAFFPDGRAVVVTFEGDVWTLRGIDERLTRLEWRRFASGLYEPLGVEIVDDRIYVHSRQGIVRLHDLNRDGEADFYENFADAVAQSIESREFPLGFQAKPGGGFYLSKGGALDNGPKTAPAILPGFRAGSRFAGTVVEVSADGRTVRTFATGLREPFIGVHPTRGRVTASDQQGNFVPSTPIYLLTEGGYYGVPATAHRADTPRESPPLVWVPHAVDQSGASQVWVTSGRMGFGGDALIHLSYGRPGVFRVLVDSTASGAQGAIVSMLDDFRSPLLNGAVHPVDGQLYLAGFQIWGSKAREVSTLSRLRYTGRPSTLPTAVRAGRQGVLLQFAVPLDSATALDPSSFHLLRWNYRRTAEYGSGYFRLDGTPGTETLGVASAHLSSDRRSVLLVVPDMREVMQMEVGYALRGADGRPVADTLHLTLNHLRELDLAAAGLGAVDWKASMARGPRTPAPAEAGPAGASAERGSQIFQRIGCVGCHSVDGSNEGKLGPTMRGLFGSTRSFVDGTRRTADEDYLRQSIRAPASQIVAGYAEGMPAYTGVLGDAEIESLVLYLKSLGGTNRPDR